MCFLSVRAPTAPPARPPIAAPPQGLPPVRAVPTAPAPAPIPASLCARSPRVLPQAVNASAATTGTIRINFFIPHLLECLLVDYRVFIGILMMNPSGRVFARDVGDIAIDVQNNILDAANLRKLIPLRVSTAERN